MGLLDGLLGQVLGGLAQGGGAPGGAGRAGPMGGGGLGDLLNQMGGGGMPGRGGMPGMPGDGGMPGPGGMSMGGLAGGGLGALLMLALQMMQQSGGLGNVLGRMQQQGYGREADSWVSPGENLPVNADILSQIFGREQLGQAAEQMGLSPDEAAGGLASIFPEVVNQMTPRGQIEPESNDVVAQALEILRQQGRG
jgi:uncharacterized protein YidB (DUF937 family)